jgi:hypothetical protein
MVEVVLPTGTATILHTKTRFTLTPPKGKPIDLSEGDQWRTVMAVSVDHAFVATVPRRREQEHHVRLATGAKRLRS